MSSRLRRMVLVTLLAWTGCQRAPQSMLAPAGPAAAGLSSLSTFVFVLFTLVMVVMLGLILAAALRRRGTLGEHAPWDTGGGHGWVVIGGFVIPVAILAVVFVLGLAAMERFPLHDEEHPGTDIRVIGHQWWWELQYQGTTPSQRLVTANEIHIPVGQPVDFALDSVDVIHSLWLPRLHGKVDLVPGRTNHVRLQADEAGTYEGQCAEFCGAEHSLMRLLVVAEPPEVFAKWLAHQATPAVAPASPQAEAGRRLFETRACGLCHTVRGTQALGTVGPDLTHLAGRSRIAANTLRNSHAYLSAWAVRAQSFKPGAQMPDLTAFTGEELEQLATWLQGLE